MTSKLAKTINEHINMRVQNGELSNVDIMSITDNLTQFFNPLTVSDYAKAAKHQNG